MIEKLRAYSDHRESGVPWAPYLPAHWKTERAKWLFTKMARPVRDHDEVVTCYRDGTVTLRSNRRLRGYTEAAIEHGYQGIRKGDLVIHGMDAFAGAVGVAESDGKSTPVYSVCSPKPGVDARYYAYVLRHMAQSQWILALAKGIRERSTDFRYDTFGDQRVPLPPISEQIAIVRFLAWANGRLDRTIRAKRKIIALLNEQAQTIIKRIVTQGVEPDVKLKSSGIPWIGEIPMHWELTPLRTLFAEIKDRGHDGEQMLSVTIKRGVITQEELLQNNVKRDSSNDDKSKYKRLLPGDIVYNKMRAWQGAFGVSAHLGIVSPAYVVMRPTARAESRYYHFLFRTPAFSKVAESWSYGIASDMWSLRPEHFRLIVVPVPPVLEQARIASRLEEITAEFGRTVYRLEREIDLLREYRNSLVADVVTGLLDVREAGAHLSDEATLGTIQDAADLSDELDLAEAVAEV